MIEFFRGFNSTILVFITIAALVSWNMSGTCDEIFDKLYDTNEPFRKTIDLVTAVGRRIGIIQPEEPLLPVHEDRTNYLRGVTLLTPASNAFTK